MSIWDFWKGSGKFGPEPSLEALLSGCRLTGLQYQRTRSLLRRCVLRPYWFQSIARAFGRVGSYEILRRVMSM